MSMPEEILRMESVFNSIPGISDVYIGNQNFTKEEFEEIANIYFPGVYADLPIALLKRTGGNLDKELLVNVEFRIDSTTTGLKALEFLSWWVRDLARSGENLQIRTIGLPPKHGDVVQLGETLRFWLEAYIVTEEEDIQLVLNEISRLADSLKENLVDYQDAFN